MNNFLIVVPVYNAGDYIAGCLASLAEQDYPNFRVIIIDDCSTDSTPNTIQEYLHHPNFQCIRNPVRTGSALGNIVKAIQAVPGDPDEIILNVDGDDKLAFSGVLSYLDDIYINSDVWVTYGQFIPASDKYGPYCLPIEDFENYRHGDWVTSHLRTWRRHLWDRIRDEDFLDTDGEYYKTAWDLAIMYPLIEMAGPERLRFIEHVLYIYNDLNPLNDMKQYSQLQIETGNRIRNKPKYFRIV